MRDYRGKRLDTGEWVTGAWLPVTHTIMYEKGLGLPFSAWIVDHATVGQCTGVFGLFHWQGDVEGGTILRSFIYEGDIVEPVQTLGTYKGFSWGRQVVVFDRGAFCLKDSRGITTTLRSYSVNVEFKVWGNVHDNPELLEV